MLDERSPVPLYYQLQEIIRERIESGQWGPGAQLPPEAELCKEFNLSRGTVRQALADLVREGKLNRRRGKGSFVSAAKISQDLRGLSGFSAYAREMLGSELGNRLISVKLEQSDQSLASKLEVEPGTEVTIVRKVKTAGDRPFFITTSYIPCKLCPGLEKDDHSTGSLVALIQSKYGYKMEKVKGWFEPVLTREYEASLLEVERGSPALLYERVRYTGEGKPFMMSKNVIRGDMCRLTFQIEDPSHA